MTKIKLWQQLIRLDKPIGIYLLLWPLFTALFIASRGQPPAKFVVIFGLGAFLARSAGCIINDMIDRNIDQHVARTKNRVLARGRLSLIEASGLMIVLLAMGLFALLQLNRYTIGLGVLALGFTIIYPFLKRITYLPQVGLGITFNLGILMAFTAIQNQLPMTAWLLYGSAVLSTLAYDTFYAMVDQPDDERLGIKSTARLFAHHSVQMISLFEIISMALLLIVGVMSHLNVWYYVGLSLASFWIGIQQYLIHTQKNKGYFAAFTNHHWISLIIFIGCYLSYLP